MRQLPLRFSMVGLLLTATLLAGCRDTTSPDAGVPQPDRSAVTAGSAIRDTLPFHIRQEFRPVGAGTIDCGNGIALPDSFAAVGVLTPHLGRTTSLLVVRRCIVSGDTVRMAGLGRHVGATRDTLYAVWIAEVDRASEALSLEIHLVGLAGRFARAGGLVMATGEINLAKGNGWYRGTGTIGPRGPVAGGAPLVPETISAGRGHSCGLTIDGAAYCWGRNDQGQLGDGTTTTRSGPTPVAGGLVFVQIVAGDGRTCGLTPAGAAYCWGNNEYGQLGDGTYTSRLLPTAVSGGLAFTAIGGELYHTCALLAASGHAYCWGRNDAGQLATADAVQHPTPTPIFRAEGNLNADGLTQISVGAYHTCAIQGGSYSLFCWGADQYAQSSADGIASGYVNRALLIRGSWSYVSVGLYHTCALSQGGAMCWGLNTSGQLGYYYEGYNPSPRWLYNATFTRIDAGYTHTCGIGTLDRDPSHAGSTYCWGANDEGQLGSGAWQPMSGAEGRPFVQVRAGATHTCAVDADGVGYCWGDNQDGQLGDRTTTDRAAPLPVAPLAFASLGVGFHHSCALDGEGRALCWGRNDRGQLGIGSTTAVTLPTLVSGAGALARIDGGGYHTCGLTLASAASCWGANYVGQLGDGTTTDHVTPTAVVGGIAFLQVGSGYDHSCGVTTKNLAYCWGENSSGQLGDGTTTSHTSPTPVAGGLLFASVQAGVQHTCGLTIKGVAYCWGSNGQGQLGDGTSTSRLTPTATTGLQVFTSLVSGSYHNCALTSAGAAYCWGNDGVIPTRFPNPVSGAPSFTELTAGDSFTCGLSGGAAYCWGANQDGQLGDGTTLNHPLPETVAGGLTFTRISAGESHVCATTPTGTAYCWGWNYHGQLGNGSTAPAAVPTLAGRLRFR